MWNGAADGVTEHAFAWITTAEDGGILLQTGVLETMWCVVAVANGRGGLSFCVWPCVCHLVVSPASLCSLFCLSVVSTTARTRDLHRRHITIHETPLHMASHAASRSLVVATEAVDGTHHVQGFNWQLERRWDIALAAGHRVTHVAAGTLRARGVTAGGGTQSDSKRETHPHARGLAQEFVFMASSVEPSPTVPQRAPLDTGVGDWEVAPDVFDIAATTEGMVSVMQVQRAVRASKSCVCWVFDVPRDLLC